MSIEDAREAMARRDWHTAYRELSAARPALSTDDLLALGDAAWWLGLVRETLAITEECNARFLAEGRFERAAMNALGIGFTWLLRGEPTVGTAWLARARRLLDDRPDCVEKAFLLWLDVTEALEKGDLDAALVLTRQVQDAGRRFASADLDCLGLLGEATVAVQRGELRRGFDLLDEAMLPVLAGRVGPDWAGNVYCQVIALSHDLGDLPRARHWIEVTERWCGEMTGAVMFLGICRMHRVQLLLADGELDAAEREASVATTELADMNVAVVAEAHYLLGEIRRVRGQHAAAESCYLRAGAMGRDPQPGHALLLLGQGRPAEAHGEVRAALAATAGYARAPLLAALVEIAVGVPDPVMARAAADELNAITGTYPTPGFTALAARARELVAGSDPPPPAPGRLTARECEVLVHVAGGATNREAAAALFISEKTVARHLANVYAKLGVSTRTAAAAWAHEHLHIPVP